MHVACKRGLSRLVRRLLEFQANPNLQTLPPDSVILSSDDGLQTAYRLTPLHMAIAHKQEGAVNAMLHHHSKFYLSSLLYIFTCSIPVCYLFIIVACCFIFRYYYSRTQRRIFYC